MGEMNERKLKLLYVYQMLMDQTDAKTGLTMADILRLLEEKGISAERKSIYRDIDALRAAGVDVITLKKHPATYAVKEGKPSLSEVTMLLDAVQSSRFLSEGSAKRLSNIVKGLAPQSRRDSLDKQVHVEGRVAHQNESVFHNVDAIQDAIRLRRKITFQYRKYGTDAELHPTREELYKVTPLRLVFSDGKYYVIAWSDEHEMQRTFRVDRMYLTQATDEPASRQSGIKAGLPDEFAYKAFSMFNGDAETVKLRVKAAGMDVLADDIGLEKLEVYDVTEEECTVFVPVKVSNQFFGWLAGLHGIIDLVGPTAVAERYRAWAQSLLG